MNSHQEDIAAMKQWIDSAIERGAVPVVAGQNGDMDTIGSAIALASIHPSLLACGLHLGRIAKRLVEDLQAPFRKVTPQGTAFPEKLGGIIIVDAAAPDQVGIDLPDVPRLILDHHATNGWTLRDGDHMLQWDVRATTEMVATYMFEHAIEALSPPVRKMLLAGMITDTARFKHANTTSFEVTTKLLHGTKIDYAKFCEYIEREETSPSERGSLLRGLGRAKSHDVGAWSLVTTYAGTLEGRLASMLLGTGFDVSLVSRHREGETRLTARATRKATLRGVHLGAIMQTIAEQHGGDGGGHDGAAGWTGQVDRIRAESAFIAQLTLQREVKQ
ncbi:MAG: DHH family phosphoesterase [Candidatus Poseidoniaceae archaeon]